ncbi:MAG: S8 family serine peptidase [Bdellovibrionales bacterium]
MNKFLFIATTLMASVVFAKTKTPEAVPGEFVVKLKPAFVSISAQALSQQLQAQVKEVINREGDLVLVQKQGTRKSAIASLSSTGIVEYAEPNFIYRIGGMTPDDAQYKELWGMKNTGQTVSNVPGVAGIDINAEKAWEITTGSKNVIVGVIDTGVDFNIPDLKATAWVNEAEAKGRAGVDDDKNGYVDDINGYDFVNNDGDPTDDHGHGSHVSGTIGGQGNNGMDVVGVNWNVTIMGLKFLSASGSGSLASAIKAIDYATMMGAHFTSNSWGGGGFSQALFDSIKKANDKNMLFIAAAGNNGTNNDTTPQYPANYQIPNVISVAAITNTGAKASFSCYGARTVHVGAPGNYILSTIPMALDGQDGKRDGLASWRGTSMATPHVSGVAALVLAKYPGMSAMELKDRLVKTARPLSGMKGVVSSGGIVDAYNALTNTMPPPDANDPANWPQVDHMLSSPHPYGNNVNQTFTVTIPDATKIALTFSKFETEAGYDIVKFYDGAGVELGSFSGNHTGEFSPVAMGNTIKMVFTTDGDVTQYGFDITKVAIQK